MTPQKQREIVIEFEKVRTIRKRAKTSFAFCPSCGTDTDFVELLSAAQLFDIYDGDLAAFVAANAVHHDGDMDICFPSLLAVMHARTNGLQVKQIGRNADASDNF